MRAPGFGVEEGAGELTLLVRGGADRFDQVVQRGHEFGVAADAGEVGFRAARGGDAGFCCGLLEMVSGSWCFEGKGVFEEAAVLTAHVGSSVRLPALAKGAAKMARAAMEYFIVVSFLLEVKASSMFLWFENSKRDVLQCDKIF